MTIKESIELLTSPNKHIDCKTYRTMIDTIKNDLEILEIIKNNPELVWWCCCYETAEQMIIDRKGLMLDYSMKEIREQFNKVKEWLKNEKM